MANLVMLTQIHTSMNQEQPSYSSGEQLIRTSTVSTVTTKRNFFVVCFLSRRNAREVSHGRPLAIKLSRGKEKRQTPVASAGVGKLSNLNRRQEVLVTNDLRISST